MDEIVNLRQVFGNEIDTPEPAKNLAPNTSNSIIAGFAFFAPGVAIAG